MLSSPPLTDIASVGTAVLYEDCAILLYILVCLFGLNATSKIFIFHD